MYAIAVIGDVLSVVPFLNVITNVGTAIGLYIAGGESGVDLYSPEQVGITLAVLAGEAIPGISAIPLWTARVYFAKKSAKAQQ